MAFRRKVGARVIQLASGSWPTISECACCEIWRIKVLRYPSGIQSRASMVSPASILASNAASSGDSSPLVSGVTICAYIEGRKFHHEDTKGTKRKRNGDATQRVDLI